MPPRWLNILLVSVAVFVSIVWGVVSGEFADLIGIAQYVWRRLFG